MGDDERVMVKESFIGVVDDELLKRNNLAAAGELGLGKLADTQLGSRPPHNQQHQHQQQPSNGKTRLGNYC